MKNNQKGFSAVEILLALIILILIGFTGWYVYNRSNSAPEATDQIKHAPTKNNENVSLDTNYLEIPELGIKVRLNDDTRDLTYSVIDTDIAVLSSESLARTEPLCAVDKTSGPTDGIGIIGHFTDPNATELSPTREYKNSEVFPEALNVGGKYYYIATGHSFCVNKGTKNHPEDDAYQIETKLIKALRGGDVVLEKL